LRHSQPKSASSSRAVRPSPRGRTDEELERRPGAPARVEHAIDLPLGEERVILLARLGPVGELRQAAELARELRPLLDGTLEPLLAERDVEPGFAQRVGE